MPGLPAAGVQGSALRAKGQGVSRLPEQAPAASPHPQSQLTAEGKLLWEDLLGFLGFGLFVPCLLVAPACTRLAGVLGPPVSSLWPEGHQVFHVPTWLAF